MAEKTITLTRQQLFNKIWKSPIQVVVKEFIVHPDAIKHELNAGDAFLVSKVGGFRQDKFNDDYQSINAFNPLIIYPIFIVTIKAEY